MVELIITEKPSSAKKVAAALADGRPVAKKNGKVGYFELTHNGKKILVASAVGHLYGLAEVKKHGWTYPVFEVDWHASYEGNDELDYIKGYVDTLKKLSQHATKFTIACDYDVEGEVIGLNVIRYACKKKDAHRMKFSTLTKEDLVHAYENKSSHLDWGQAHAGETRHKLDWYYGINVSRALTASVKAAGSFKVMSAGRVQGPALKLLVDREKEIQAFKPEPFWEISLDGEYKKENVEAWHTADKIFDKMKVTAIMKKVSHQKQATITEVKRTRRNQQPPHPFHLTALQSEAYGLFKITPKQTLAIAQKLYLSGLTSYPRTSSQKLDPKLGFKKILTDLSKQSSYAPLTKLLLQEKTLQPNNGKKDDPAHPAIYPTGQVPKSLVGRDNKVYDLIVKRFLATFGKPAVRETMQVFLDVNKEMFIAKGTRTLEENWHKFYKPYVNVEEVSLPDMQKSEKIKIKKITKHNKETQPPNRFNQSSIIKELEKRNLGTKATRADILDRLFQRGYIDGVQITVSELGMETVRLLEKYAHIIVEEHLTREFELDMKKIRLGKEKPEKVLSQAKRELMKLLSDFKKKEKVIGEEIIQSIRDSWDAANFMGNCPKCKKGRLMVRRGKFGRFVGCEEYPNCKTILNIPKKGFLKFTGDMDESTGWPIVIVGAGRGRKKVTLTPHEDANKPHKKKYSAENMTCPTCNTGKMILRKSFYGEFLGCDGYPKCKTMMKIKEGKVDTANPVVKTDDKKVVKKKAVKKKVRKKKMTKKKVSRKKVKK